MKRLLLPTLDLCTCTNISSLLFIARGSLCKFQWKKYTTIDQSFIICFCFYSLFSTFSFAQMNILDSWTDRLIWLTKGRIRCKRTCFTHIARSDRSLYEIQLNQHKVSGWSIGKCKCSIDNWGSLSVVFSL